jgi:hypothetical protein
MGPVQVPVVEIKGNLAIDGTSHKDFDGSAVRAAQFGIEAPPSGKFVGRPFVGSNATKMPSLHMKGSPIRAGLSPISLKRKMEIFPERGN